MRANFLRIIRINPGPFGTRWMGLNKPGYGIHGTNAPKDIGRDLNGFTRDACKFSSYNSYNEEMLRKGEES